MSIEDFKKFIKREKSIKPGLVDWEERRRSWITELDHLYMDVENWLRNFINEQSVLLNYIDIIIDEGKLGRYKAREMKIVFTGIEVTLKPVASMLIGSRGQVNLLGLKKTIQFTLMQDSSISKEEPRFSWKISSFKINNLQQELNEDSFFFCLMQVVKE